MDKFFAEIWKANKGFVMFLVFLFSIIIVVIWGKRIALSVTKIFRRIFGSAYAPNRGSEGKLTDEEKRQIPEGWKPNALAAELYNATKGGNNVFIDKRFRVLQKVDLLNDPQLKTLAKYFEDMYANKDFGSLSAWLIDETIFNRATDSLRDSIVRRLNAMGF